MHLKKVLHLCLFIIVISCVRGLPVSAQNMHIGIATVTATKGQVIDAVTGDPIQGVTIRQHSLCNCTDQKDCHCLSDKNGIFQLQQACHAVGSCVACDSASQQGNPDLQNIQNDSLYISAVNYTPIVMAVQDNRFIIIKLHAKENLLQQVIVTSTRFRQNRADIPAAIGVVDSATIEQTKATQLDQLVNKVPGVFMVDLGNEQHEMSIRQPMTTESLFLYLEDGMPIRTSGLYNHNALLEMNMAAMDRIEILKGPASAQYGPEAVGGAVNIITASPPQQLGGKAQVQADNNGYKRTDLSVGDSFGKLGVLLSGYYANRHGGPIDYNDFHKTALTLKAGYTITKHLKWENTGTYINYLADMSGSLDSLQFAGKDFSSHYRFTNRNVKAFRWTSTLEQNWNPQADSKLAFMYRNNQTGQNPSYRIKDNKTDPTAASGEINLSAFESFVALLQHRQKFNWLNGQLVAGLSADISPSNYHANYIQVTKNAEGDYTSFKDPDSLLTKYTTNINNYAAFLQMQISPLNHLQLTLAGRYDHFDYRFNNALPSTAVSGAPSSNVPFNHWTPKVGISYHLDNIGFYGNYAQGYVPPQVTELFNNVKVPFLKPQVFHNYEIGGWMSMLHQHLYADWSLYTMKGEGEIISVRNEDGSFENKNAGETRHTGLEYGLHYRPDDQWDIQISGTVAKHEFISEIQNGVDLSHHEMSTAPRTLNNANLTYHPMWLKGFRIGAEFQQMGNYYMDDANTVKYQGFTIFNLRTGYTYHAWSVWANALNLLNRYYSNIATKSAYGYSYNLGNPFTLAIGLQYTF